MPQAPSLYRRHRPRSFAEVVGQEHVVRTLRNAVTQGKVHHAYLFVGSRGTGKTSMAKILAACLNCEQGPTIQPCGVCDSCISIASATSLDVIEMDAASNNSVDDIRDLRESVVYAPVSGRHKVYILDEAHMLSTQAWNAFLKTLEEPPPNTVFVLATTEAAKVLPTVVDRCHRFDFARPTVEQLAAVVRRVATTESITMAPDAVALLARHATGSFRDALGTLEQLVTYAGDEIATEDVLAVLGVADADLLFASLDAIAASDPRAALLAAARLTDTGRDALGFVRDLEAHARDLMIVQTLGDVPAELRITPDRDARLLEQAGRVGAAAVARLLDLLAAALEATRNGSDARTQLELALVKAASPTVDPSREALLQRIERLEAALAGGAVAAVASGAPTPPRGAGAEAPAGAPPRAQAPPATTATSARPPAPAHAPATAATAAPARPLAQAQPPEAGATTAPGRAESPTPPSQPAPGRAESPQPAPGRAESPTPPSQPAPGPESPAPPPAPPPEAGTTAAPGRAESPTPPSQPAPGPESPAPPSAPSPEAPTPPSAPPPSAPAPAAARADAAPPAAPGNANGVAHATTVAVPVDGAELTLDLAGLRAVWPAVIDKVMSENALCAALLADATPIAIDGPIVTVAFPPTADFLRRKADDDGYRRCVAEAVRTVTGAKAQIAYVLAEVSAAEEHDLAAPAPPTEDEWVRRFVAEFDAEEIVPDPDDPGPSSESEVS
ncbi:MAG TPA: DNA polymerase III subunit gamma/tau [Solirubrobacteraceae bacterium]|nr:DNA polymerase III subunit gamma/tau [Solirubrobacteraceae bacterium]